MENKRLHQLWQNIPARACYGTMHLLNFDSFQKSCELELYPVLPGWACYHQGHPGLCGSACSGLGQLAVGLAVEAGLRSSGVGPAGKADISGCGAGGVGSKEEGSQTDGGTESDDAYVPVEEDGSFLFNYYLMCMFVVGNDYQVC